ncbi:hypothetical protein HN681_02795 [archaeon]|jgi:hypothetical protein|nr:hypothetical protein [archaeon]MBT3731156.1 hypothetical protein [archaeon]MBT4670090.1 hypothetical protein [archaeon]MBT5030610.1 hypothetical protein [archaeon]MBT5287962.1 hypothetical protein [archaeon]
MGKEKFKTLPIFIEYQITHNAYIDFLEIVRNLPSFFDEHKYYFFEQKRSEKDTGVGFEIESVWIASREVDHYVKFEIQIQLFLRDVRKVVLEDGKETFWARAIVRLNSSMVKNHNKTFKTDWWNETLRQFYERYVIRPRLDAFEGKAVEDCLDLVEHIKSRMK